uniref:Serpentine Receptor, class T n=1 Tax=Rhabditophanes sp. KR3021 TaxID=114890 RepID=A0AC35TUH1_9BILA
MVEFNLMPNYIKKYYSCDALTNQQWQDKRVPNVILGSFYLIFGVVGLLLYVPILTVLTKKEIRKNNVYKLIISITIADTISLWCSSILCGYWQIRGSFYCTDPITIYAMALISEAAWAANSVLGVVLALNRCLDAFNAKWSNCLFKGNKIYLWIAIAAAYAIFLGFFTPPMLFTSKRQTVFFDPFVGIDNLEVPFRNHYENWGSIINNIILFVTLPILYGLFCIMMMHKSNTNSARLTKMQTSFLIQSSLLCFVTFIVTAIYILQQFVIINQAFIVIGHFAWIISSSTGAFTYLSFNRTIRKHIINDFKLVFVKNIFSSKVIPALSVENGRT